MRTRKQKRIYFSHLNSSEDEGYDSTYSDPDYTIIRQQRRSRSNNVGSSSSNAPTQMADRTVQMEGTTPEIGSSSRSNNGSAVERRCGRRPNYGGERGPLSRQPSNRLLARTTRRSRSSDLHQTPSTSNNSSEVLSSKKTVLSWLIDKEIIQKNEQVWYMDESHNVVLQKGKITPAGVLCCCCDKVITVHEFEGHAQRRDLKMPYDNIYLVRLQSYLLSIMVKALQREDEVTFNLIQLHKIASDRNDDACINVPQGDWLCPRCVCKFCGAGSNTECLECEMKYHEECLLETKDIDLNCPNAFCSNICGEIYTKLQQMAGVRNELDNGYSWTLLQWMPAWTSSKSGNHLHKMVECNCKIAVIWTVMDEIFLPNIDRSNLVRLNFGRFFTAVLEHNDEIISVASLRVHGNKLAEMPFVGTCEKYRGKGMLQKLLTALESALCFLKVENLVIPSVPELVPMWKEKYSFSPISNSLMNDLIFTNTLMFPTAIRLQKSLALQPTDPTDADDDKLNRVALPDLNLAPPEDDLN
ncbi:increased DNA methylation 1-like [Mangifera indica]|uniref:increased DNA methylation 1-like n=1 Tax=Mangifera indica TaxID=29780 RepID=UPI001CFBBC5A|nr:increased DNA methylation 1-like [Mangifera indica]